ncbi:MAG: hypothetical protein HQL80_12935 [Magnetococcales bacterium]|nr:hypothetical protein [Magnetococcales bacterium]
MPEVIRSVFIFMGVKILKAKDVVFWWAVNDSAKVTAVMVVDFLSKDNEKLERGEISGFDSNCGKCNDGWMEKGGYNTEELFGSMLMCYGFADYKAIHQALTEFAKVKECGWARKMLLAINDNNIIRPDKG